MYNTNNLQQQCGPDWAAARSPRTRPSKLVATSRQVFVKEFVIVFVKEFVIEYVKEFVIVKEFVFVKDFVIVITSILHVSKTSQLAFFKEIVFCSITTL